jgi:hypothetical protein
MVVRLPAREHIFSADGPESTPPSGGCRPTPARATAARSGDPGRRRRTSQSWRRGRPSRPWSAGALACVPWCLQRSRGRLRSIQRWERQGDLRDLPELRTGIQLLLADDAAPVVRSNLGSNLDRGADDRQLLIACVTRDRRVTTPLDDVSDWREEWPMELQVSPLRGSRLYISLPRASALG